MQEVRDKVLSLLQYHFNSEQLMMIDIALAEATKGFVLTPVETLPTIRIDILPEIGEFIFATGYRISEVVALNRTDIDFYTRTIKVTGKGDKERFVYLNAAAIVALEDYFAERKDHQEALFVSTRRPYQRLKNNAIEKIVGRIGERVGINRKVFPHLIRHTMATYMINHGMRIERLQIILGHEKADTTRIYAKDDPEVTKHEYFLAS